MGVIRHFTKRGEGGGRVALDMGFVQAVMEIDTGGTILVTSNDTYGVTEPYEFCLRQWADVIEYLEQKDTNNAPR